VVCGGIGYAIASAKNRPPSEGVILGVLLGVIGVVIELCLSKQEPTVLPPESPTKMKSAAKKNCPECAESILADARVCRYCGHHLPTTNLRCFKCKHVQAVLASQTKFTCEQCGQCLERNTTPPKRENAAQSKKES
jgi:hypothetical protein